MKFGTITKIANYSSQLIHRNQYLNNAKKYFQTHRRKTIIFNTINHKNKTIYLPLQQLLPFACTFIHSIFFFSRNVIKFKEIIIVIKNTHV